MTTDPTSPATLAMLWTENFEVIHCDWFRASDGQACRLAPAWRDKTNGQLLCDNHQLARWNYVKEANDASAVRTGS
jgi:hypothetical protein